MDTERVYNYEEELKMKRIVGFLSLTLIIAVVFGTMLVSAAGSPNTVWKEVNGTSITGYIQHKPSYLDNNRHAMQGRIRIILQDEDDNISYTGYSYTTLATSIYDTTVYSTSKSAIIPSGGLYFIEYAFYWSPGGNWETHYFN